MGKTRIEWTQATWNPVTGCSPISPGCAHCYAARMAKRLAGRAGYPEAPDEFKVTVHPQRLGEPLRWKDRRMVFVCSMGDLFHEDVPDEYIDAMFAVMALAKRHTFQILSKRPDRMRDYFKAGNSLFGRMNEAAQETGLIKQWQAVMPTQRHGMVPGREWPLGNVWLGVTAENQEQADKRIPVLLEIPAAVLFVSVEPMLEEIVLDRREINGWWNEPVNYLTGEGDGIRGAIDWVICGGETGPGARPMHPQWVRSLRDQCQTAETQFFFKSWGDWCPKSHTELFPTFDNSMRWGVLARDGEFYENTTPWNGRNEVSPDFEATVYRIGKKAAGRLLDGRTWDEFPSMVGTC